MKYVLSTYDESFSDQESVDKKEFLFSYSSQAHGRMDKDSGSLGQEFLTWQIEARGQESKGR